MRAAVLGAGSWGTTFAKVLADAGTEATLWARRSELADWITSERENPDYLPGIELPAKVTATHDAARAVADAELVAFAVPSQSLRANLEVWRDLLPPHALLV